MTTAASEAPPPQKIPFEVAPTTCSPRATKSSTFSDGARSATGTVSTKTRIVQAEPIKPLSRLMIRLPVYGACDNHCGARIREDGTADACYMVTGREAQAMRDRA